MTRIRRFIVMVLLVACVGIFPASANMPVVDFTAITEGIAQFLSEVEQWGRQIKQWQSEYERLLNAAKTMSQGGFNNIMNGLQSMAGQIAGWDSTNGAWDSFFSSFGDVTGMIQDLGNSGADVFESLQDSWNIFEGIPTSGDAWDILGGFGTLLSNSANATKALGYLGDYVGDISDIAVETNFLLRASGELVGLDGIEGLEKTISELQRKIIEARASYLNAINNQNETLAEQYRASIENWTEQIEQYQRQIDELEENRKKAENRKQDLADQEHARLEASALAVERALRDSELSWLADATRDYTHTRFGFN